MVFRPPPGFVVTFLPCLVVQTTPDRDRLWLSRRVGSVVVNPCISPSTGEPDQVRSLSADEQLSSCS